MQLNREQLLQAYRRRRAIRVFQENVKTEFEKGNIPRFMHSCVGHEACAVGVCMNLNDSDYIGSTHRGHGQCIAKGCDIKAMMREIYGRRTGCAAVKADPMHTADFERGCDVRPPACTC